MIRRVRRLSSCHVFKNDYPFRVHHGVNYVAVLPEAISWKW